MRQHWVALTLFCIAGCASRPAPAPTAIGQGVEASAEPSSDQAVAASLVYDSPLLAGAPRYDISRQDRAPAAYAGYEDIITTFYYLYTDDRQTNYNNCRHDRYDRQAITVKTGVSYR